MALPKFPKAAPAPSFHWELKKRVQNYFDEKGVKSTGNFSLYFKAAILTVLIIGLYTHLVFFTPALGWALLECGLLGAVISAVGFNVMHDGAHGSFSTKPWVNTAAAYSLNILGGSAFMWNVKHNIVHHAYTNVNGIDDDIDAGPLLRLSPEQKRLGIHKYQHYYFWFLYCLLYLYWVFVSDYKKYFSKKVGEMTLKKMDTQDHILFWTFKALYYGLFLVVPMVFAGVLPTIIGFVVMMMIAGFILSIVFQLAHTVEHTEFPVADINSNKLENEWMIHQLKTTANFAMKSKLVSWYVGGLNFQVEHHLFPKISHIHYPAISKIIAQTCKEFNVPYISYPKMRHAVASHWKFLREVGMAA